MHECRNQRKSYDLYIWYVLRILGSLTERLKNQSHVVFVYSILFCLLVGCRDDYASVSFLKVESDGTGLIDTIKSYQSINEFKGFLSRRSFRWEESEDQPSPKGRPPFNMHTITIKNYVHLGFSGELDIAFFNNRLISTRFYPTDPEKYIEVLGEVAGIRFDSAQEAKLLRHTRVRFGIDYKGRKYVDWSDFRLDKEVELWIKRYS